MGFTDSDNVQLLPWSWRDALGCPPVIDYLAGQRRKGLPNCQRYSDKGTTGSKGGVCGPSTQCPATRSLGKHAACSLVDVPDVLRLDLLQVHQVDDLQSKLVPGVSDLVTAGLWLLADVSNFVAEAHGRTFFECPVWETHATSRVGNPCSLSAVLRRWSEMDKPTCWCVRVSLDCIVPTTID
eukprot:4131396-Amphidinium_carterae.1